jgi:protein tyrosine phosphatase (PTP) superfamily phosphohydrolase (DUF442 family)
MRRALGDALTRFRIGVVRGSPPWARRALGPAAMHLDMLVLDHGILRLLYPNRHRISAATWRSGQPHPRQIRAWARLGIRTVLNLRGGMTCGSYWLEREACEECGIRLVDFALRSYEAPSKAQLQRARGLFQEVEYPLLMHCKSGADRTGLMGVLYRVAREGASVPEARRELSLRFGHLRLLGSGILDHFLDAYLADSARTPLDFFDWVERVYDRDAVTRSYRALSWWGRLASRSIDRRGPEPRAGAVT